MFPSIMLTNVKKAYCHPKYAYSVAGFYYQDKIKKMLIVSHQKSDTHAMKEREKKQKEQYKNQKNVEGKKIRKVIKLKTKN